LQNQLGGLFSPIREAVREIITNTIRVSSLDENINSGLRNYFFLRHQLGLGFLDLLRFFLKHRDFMRSELSRHQGKKTAELLKGEEHCDWLELLGLKLLQ